MPSDLTESVQAATVIDFVVDPGPAANNAPGLSATITAVP